MVYLTLCLEFMKIGVFAIGGGMVTVPFLYELAEKYTWFTHDMVTNMIAISESTPGPIGINMATFAGFRAGFAQDGLLGGLIGGALASVALILPAFLIVLALAGVLMKYYTHPFVSAVFKSLRPAVTGLIAAAGFTILWSAVVRYPNKFGDFSAAFTFDYKAWLLFAAILFGTMKWKKHPALYLGIAAVAGMAMQL